MQLGGGDYNDNIYIILMKRIIVLLVAAMVSVGVSAAQGKKKNAKKSKTEQTAKKPAAKKGSIQAVLKDSAVYHKGLFEVVEQGGEYYFLVPTGQLGKDFLVVGRMSRGAADLKTAFSGYSGDKISEQLVRFNLSPDQKHLFLQGVQTFEMPRDTTGAMYQNVVRSNFQPIMESFEIKGKNSSNDTLLIEVTNFLLGDNPVTSFDAWTKRGLNIGGFQKDKSYISGVQSFPINTEITTIKTYTYTPAAKGYDGKPLPSSPATFELNTSIIALPEVPMQPRYADSRVGYFTERYVDYDKNPQGVKPVSMITRWRLEPKAEDMEAYKRGELVEPEQQIVFYIDPTTPKEWVPYLIQGVNDWEPVFRRAGFKNAIVGLEAPVGDSTWSLNDARHSAIVYKPSTTPNASGPHIRDPRTGQILESHINWYHNVMSLLRNWYMLQAGPNDPRAQQMEFPVELMGELVRFVSSHEVGHTLGLRHNFGSTSMVPVDSLRSATYLQKHGHATSIMDYTRFNYVVQPEDNIAPELQYPRIQNYDTWAIEWGYRRFPDLTTPEAEADTLNKWIIEMQKDPRYWFGHERNPDDPRSQAEDLGDNQMKANALGIKNLERVIKGLPQWTATKNEGFDNLTTMYNQVVMQYSRYVGHVAKWVGGIYEDPITQEQGTVVYTYVPKADQKEAMQWLNTHLFKTPMWLMDTEIFQRTQLNPMSVANSIYNNNIRKIVSARVINNLVMAQTELGNKAYTTTEYFADLNRCIMVQNPNEYQRVMQKCYVLQLIAVYTESSMMDVHSLVYGELFNLHAKCKNTRNSNPQITAHNLYIANMIDSAINKK